MQVWNVLNFTLAMNNREFAKLIAEKQSLKARLRKMTKDIEEIQQILRRIDEIDGEIGV